MLVSNFTDWWHSYWSREPFPSGYTQSSITLLACLLTVIMFLIVVGNCLVCIAIFTEKSLKPTQNWFIASLAVSDMLLGLVVMPFSLARELMGFWMFGQLWCDIHAALDVLLCTASINTLCLISLDRYWSITQAVAYLKKRTPKRGALMIAGVWIFSAAVSLPPLFGWKKQNTSASIEAATSATSATTSSSSTSISISTTSGSIAPTTSATTTTTSNQQQLQPPALKTTTTNNQNQNNNPDQSSGPNNSQDTSDSGYREPSVDELLAEEARRQAAREEQLSKKQNRPYRQRSATQQPHAAPGVVVPPADHDESPMGPAETAAAASAAATAAKLISANQHYQLTEETHNNEDDDDHHHHHHQQQQQQQQTMMRTNDELPQQNEQTSHPNERRTRHASTDTTRNGPTPRPLDSTASQAQSAASAPLTSPTMTTKNLQVLQPPEKQQQQQQQKQQQQQHQQYQMSNMAFYDDNANARNRIRLPSRPQQQTGTRHRRNNNNSNNGGGAVDPKRPHRNALSEEDLDFMLVLNSGGAGHQGHSATSAATDDDNNNNNNKYTSYNYPTTSDISGVPYPSDAQPLASGGGGGPPTGIVEYPACALSDDIGYVLYSASGSFYIPCMVMVFVYIKIFLAARSRARRALNKQQPRTREQRQQQQQARKAKKLLMANNSKMMQSITITGNHAGCSGAGNLGGRGGGGGPCSSNNSGRQLMGANDGAGQLQRNISLSSICTNNMQNVSVTTTNNNNNNLSRSNSISQNNDNALNNTDNNHTNSNMQQQQMIAMASSGATQLTGSGLQQQQQVTSGSGKVAPASTLPCHMTSYSCQAEEGAQSRRNSISQYGHGQTAPDGLTGACDNNNNNNNKNDDCLTATVLTISDAIPANEQTTRQANNNQQQHLSQTSATMDSISCRGSSSSLANSNNSSTFSVEGSTNHQHIATSGTDNGPALNNRPTSGRLNEAAAILRAQLDPNHESPLSVHPEMMVTKIPETITTVLHASSTMPVTRFNFQQQQQDLDNDGGAAGGVTGKSGPEALPDIVVAQSTLGAGQTATAGGAHCQTISHSDLSGTLVITSSVAPTPMVANANNAMVSANQQHQQPLAGSLHHPHHQLIGSQSNLASMVPPSPSYHANLTHQHQQQHQLHHQHNQNANNNNNNNQSYHHTEYLASDNERHKRKLAKARERRATLILGLIMAAFICAWLPFFTLYVTRALCASCRKYIPPRLESFIFWLGYCNSAINPIIYTIFNRDFRRAFRKILFRCIT